MTRPVLLDLFCGAGGAGHGYWLAGFDVVGVDLAYQPSYPYEFIQGDWAKWLERMHEGVDAIHASPPCQGYTTMNNRHPSTSPRLIGEVREALQATGKPWVIENVPGARRWMNPTLQLHGGQFGLDLVRLRLFETNVLIPSPPLVPRVKDAAAIYGANDGRLLWTRTDGTTLHVASLERAREAMQMPWSDWDGIREAIPPAYTQWIGTHLLDHVNAS